MCDDACKASGSGEDDHEIRVTREMVDAGADRLLELGDSVSTTYLVTEVFLAMLRMSSACCREG